MNGTARPGPDPVETWLHEHDGETRSPVSQRAALGIRSEAALGALFLIWGTILAMGFVLDMALGGAVALFDASIRPVWLASLLLSGLGAWLSYELSNSEGFDVGREVAPIPG